MLKEKSVSLEDIDWTPYELPYPKHDELKVKVIHDLKTCTFYELAENNMNILDLKAVHK